MRQKIFFLFWVMFVAAFAETPLKIAVMSDIHFLSPALMDNGTAIENYEHQTAKDVRDMPAILDETLAKLSSDRPDILLIPGDLTKDGERESHLGLKKRLDELASLGTRIFVIPGNHDISIPHPVKFVGDKTEPVQNVSPQDFASIYADFGFKQAFSRDTASLSYAVALDDKTWLIAIDSNRYPEYKTSSISSGRVLPKTENWVMDLLTEARKKHIMVWGMMHHGLVEHFPYQSMVAANYLVNDWKRLAEEFADNGMKVVFTGHFHANDITELKSEAGNAIYDIETGALCAFPFPYRKMLWNNPSLDIHTFHIDSIPGKPNLASQDSIEGMQLAIRMGKNKLKQKFADLPDFAVDALSRIVGELYMLHRCGDEKINNDLKKKIERAATMFGSDAGLDLSDFQFDFPPADNDVTLMLN